jgi:hypothetical protein
MTLTPELLADLRKKAEIRTAANGGLYVDGPVLLALLDRIAELEKRVEPLCGCGSTTTTRGDPECDGCGKDCYCCKCPKKEQG